ncbi:MAG: acyl-CoA synthetase [Sedimenticola sp.]|nr:acyl-CoA synthetase [Sedimenticola sp.]
MPDQPICENSYTKNLPQCAANYCALTPLTFLARAAAIYPEKEAIIYEERRISYLQFFQRCCQLANAITAAGIKPGDTVAVMLPNIPEMLEAHYGVPITGAVLNTINTRLDPNTITHILNHGEAKLLITDREFSDVMAEAVKRLDRSIIVIDIDDPLASTGDLIGSQTYEAFIGNQPTDYAWQPPEDEWQAISLNYTSGTTGNPKGVVYHHRGAYEAAMGNALAFNMNADSVYLWTLPMFHCNGWTFTWALSAVCGTHICLRRFDPERVIELIRQHKVTHMCGAPIILNAIVHVEQGEQPPFSPVVEVAVGGAAPPSAVIASMEKMGFHVTHLYGLTETYGPATICAWNRQWDALSPDEQAKKNARQGVVLPMMAGLRVVDSITGEELPADGESIGEILLRGNAVMSGYLKNPQATEEALRDGWFHTGDLGVLHPDGYMEVKDRAKDIIISGGENISSLEVEEALFRHPAILEAAVVAKPSEKWGETPCAFVTLKTTAEPISEQEIIAWCREQLAHFKVPRHILFEPLPKTSTGKVQKTLLREKALQLASE